MPTKRCSRCKQHKPLNQFVGRHRKCSACDEVVVSGVIDRADRLQAQRLFEGIGLCPKCGEEKPPEAFARNGRGWCKECWNAYMRAYKARRKAAGIDDDRRAMLKSEYGLTDEKYNELFAQQGGRCAVCGSIDVRATGSRKFALAVDHCHKTNRVRGLLCFGCNSGLGCFDDSPEKMRAAADYIERTVRDELHHRCNEVEDADARREADAVQPGRCAR